MDARQRAGVAAVSGAIVTMLVTSGVSAQVPGLSMPPSGDNQHAIVTQYIGPAVLARAINHPTADVFGLHQFGRSLLARTRPAEAMAVFQANATRFDGAWPTHVGLMRGHAALGNTQQALEHARKALEQAPDDLNRTNLRSIIANLEAGRPIG